MFSKRTLRRISVGISVVIALTVIQTLSITTKVQAQEAKAKNVIYLIADGMNDGVLTASRYYKDMQDGKLDNTSLEMEKIRTGYVKTTWANGPITDSAPAASALSSGYKTNPGVVGLTTDNIPKATILESAELSGKSTGIVSTSEIMHATPAGFTAHVNSRNNYNAIMKQELYKSMDVVLGGGTDFFGANAGGKRSDKKDLVQDIKSLGYDYVTSKDQMNSSTSNKLWGLFASTAMDYDFDRLALDNKIQPSLKEMTEKAVNVLGKNDKGFFLMVEGSKIDWAAHANDPSGTIGDILAFDDAVKYAVDYAKEKGDTIVIVTTDHGNSGFSIGNATTTVGYDNLTFEDSVNQLRGFKLSAEKFAVLAKDQTDEKISALITQYYGYNNITTDEINLAKSGKVNQVLAARAKIGYTTLGHTGGNVYLGVYAPASVTKLKGIVDNTELPKYLCENLGLDLDAASDKLFGDIKALADKESATFEINKDDKDNPYVTITKEGVSLKINVNSNIVDVKSKDNVTKAHTITGVSVLTDGDKAFGNTNEIDELLKSELSIVATETAGTETAGTETAGTSDSFDFVILALITLCSASIGVSTFRNRKIQ